MLSDDAIENFLMDSNSIQTNWVVITGAPCSGKTSVVNILRDMGYYTNPDISRFYLENIQKGNTEKASLNSIELQNEIFNLMIENSMSLDPQKLVFLDYALPDNIAFQRVIKMQVQEKVYASAKKYKYKAVFILAPLPLVNDEIRIESTQFQTEIDYSLRTVYQELGYDYYYVPALPIQERIALILEKIR